MLYYLYGTDTHKSRAKLHELLNTLAKKRPDAEVFKMTSENWSEQEFNQLLSSRGLFEQKYIVVLDNLLEKKEIKEYLLERIIETKAAEHVFLMLEAKTDAATLKKVEKAAEKVQEFNKPEGKKESNNIFSLTNYLAQKDKKSLWISYVDFLNTGVSAEEMHGILFWQVKNMLLASQADSQQETGLSPFVYKNALSGARNFKESELIGFSARLIDMTHRVRQGKGELEVMLEKAILEL